MQPTDSPRLPKIVCVSRFAKIAFSIALSAVSYLLWLQPIVGQTPAILDDIQVSPSTETWFGWIDTPNQQLRTLLRLQKNSDGTIKEASLSTDLNPAPSPLANVQLTKNGEWKFNLNRVGSDRASFSYQGIQESADSVLGTLIQSNQKIPLDLKKLSSEPVESKMQLGANLVWFGTTEDATKPQEYRIRVYNAPPYVNSGKPRIIFDALSKGMVGVPAKFSESGDVASFEIATPGTRSRYLAKLSPDGLELVGTLNEGNALIPLTLKRWSESPSDLKADKDETKNTVATAKDELTAKGSTDDSVVNKNADSNENVERSSQSPKLSESAPAAKEPKQIKPIRRDPNLESNNKSPRSSLFSLASSELFIEREFALEYGGSTVKTKTYPNGKPGRNIHGIMTLPRSSTAKAPFPTVVMLSATGPHDQDQSIGRHKPFAAIAHYLAENGIASLRYVDRGVADEADYYSSTSEDFCKDAIAVWQFAKKHESVDPQRLGFLGHSEGATVALMAATWEPSVAFLILLSAPGLTGADISRLQIDRYSELQGMDLESRETTNLLQAELQLLATNYTTNENAFPLLIRECINRHWDGLKKIALAQDPNSNLTEVKQSLISQIEEKFAQLRQPWFRFYLSYDPITNWMLVQCPTLALWGEKDSQLMAELNRDRIANTIRRNSTIVAKLEVLPGLNHLLQKCGTGLADEYDKIEQPISSEALSRILQWTEALGIVDRISKP
jgi:pimeloyl-ACP methyl ester carboxylesterase